MHRDKVLHKVCGHGAVVALEPDDTLFALLLDVALEVILHHVGPQDHLEQSVLRVNILQQIIKDRNKTILTDNS